MTPDDPRHGTTRGFHAGCREACCKAARARYEKACRLDRLHGGRAVPSIGAQRRIQALMVLGWTSTDIAHAAGFNHRNGALQILNGQNGKPCRWVQRKTHAAIVRAYDALSMKTSTGRYADRTRSFALARGWAPPLAWDDIDNPDARPVGVALDAHRPPSFVDPVVVERILAGDFTVPTSRAEKEEACRLWAESGRSLRELADLTGWATHRYHRTAVYQRDEVA